MQSSGDSGDKLIVKKISARVSSNTVVAPPIAENKIAYSTHCCRYPSFERCAVKQFLIRFTVARALGVPTAKSLPCNVTASVHELSAKPLITVVVCTRDSAASCVAPRIEHYTARDLNSTRLVSYAHRVIREDLLELIAQIDTRAFLRDAHEYICSRTP